MRLEGKVALITGAAHGMGAEEARLFAREGAKVAIADIREDDARQVEAQIAEAGGEAMVIMLNVTQEDQWESSVAAVVAQFGKLDILVNNAGISGSGEKDNTSTDSWDKLMDVNAKSVFLGMKHAIPEMEKAGGGAIVNISSISGLWAKKRFTPATMRLRARSGW
jgi:NAD(P)-dependent dehydrogenase (short-subunit alcohol dehydrogenase family)